MNDRSTIAGNSEIVSEACAWVAQVESGDMSAADLAALREWMGRSPAHAREIRYIADRSGQLAALTEIAPALEVSAGVGHGLRKPSRRARLLAPVLGVSLMFVAAAVVLFPALLTTEETEPAIYMTAVGEYQTFVLADGTTVSLNTDTHIEVNFHTDERSVELISGEALFDVTPNPDRPFVVYADTVTAEAVGTSFVVRLRDAVTELAVVEGVVAFSKIPSAIETLARRDAVNVPEKTLPALSRPEPVIVKAGQTLTSAALTSVDSESAAEPLPMLTERDMLRKLSWTDGFLDFSETPLEEVVDELTRHNPVTIEIADPDLRELKFGGVFRTGDVEQLLGALEGLGVDVERQGTNRYLLRMAEDE